MTTLVTRLYKNRAEADAAAKAVLAKGYSKRLVNVVSADSKGSADALKATMTAAGVYPKAADVYVNKVAAGSALVVVKAPIGSFFTIRDTLDEAGPIVSGVKNEDVHVRSDDARARSIYLSDIAWGGLGPDRPRWKYLSDRAWGGFSTNRPRWKYLTDFAWGGFSNDRPRWKYLTDFAWGGFSNDRPRWKYLTDFAWGGFSNDRPRWKYLTDFAWGSFGPDRPRSKYLSDFAWGGFSKDRPRWMYLSDRGWGGAR
jgi:hypothetical protein